MRLYLAAILAGMVVVLVAGWLYWPYFSGTKGAFDIEKPRQAPYLLPDSEPWRAVLAEVVDENGMVQYRRFFGEIREKLTAYLDQVSMATPSHFPDDQHRLAFYINAYNALVIQGVLDEWPLTSVNEAGAMHHFFRDRRYRVADTRVSLHGFETKVIRQYDPRLHFALNCASISCPPLQGQPFEAQKLEQQLAQVTRQFVNDPLRNRYEPREKRWYLSSIFKWYGVDFKGEKGIRELLREYAEVDWDEDAQISYLPYDWGLNEAKSP